MRCRCGKRPPSLLQAKPRLMPADLIRGLHPDRRELAVPPEHRAQSIEHAFESAAAEKDSIYIYCNSYSIRAEECYPG